MKKKIVALCLAVALLVVAVIGGTLAYFTDTDQATNVFTVGDVDIVLHEGNSVGDLDDAYDTWLAAQRIVPAKTLDKIVTVENKGDVPAYVRVKVTAPSDMTLVWANETDNGFTLNGNVATYTKAVNAKDFTPSCLTGVTLNADVTGNVDNYNVDVIVEAIQADGFKSAAEAFAAFDATTATTATNEDQINEALAAGKNVTLTKNVETTANMALNGGTIDGNGKTLNKENSTYNAADGTVNAGIVPTGGTIKNITISGESFKAPDNKTYGFRSIYVTKGLSSNLYVEGAKLIGTYAINIQDWETPPVSTGALIVNDTEINGWVSYDGGITDASFTDCDFVTTGDYAVFRPYIDTVLTDCSFAYKYTFGAGANTDLVIELNDCVVVDGTNTVKVTATNFKEQFTVEDALKACTVFVDGVKVIF